MIAWIRYYLRHRKVMKMSNKLRARCNNLTREEREMHLKRGLEIIYGPKQF